MHTSVADIVIEFLPDSDKPAFQEGEHITGLVQLNVKENVKITEVIIELNGVGFVHHEGLDEEDLDSHDIPKIFTNKEKYLSKKATLIHQGHDGDIILEDGCLPLGNYTLPFEFKLPAQMPSTFEGSYGHIKYWAEVVLQREIEPDLFTRKPFRIISGLNLNFLPQAAEKIEICKRKHVGGPCCVSGSVTIDWNVDKSGFISGEEIRIHGAVQNESKVSVMFSRVSLIMVADYKTKKGKRRERQEVTRVEKGETEAGDVAVWDEHLSVPVVPPTTLNKSKIIDVYYELQFLAEIEDQPYRPILVYKDIYIGTEPINLKVMKSCMSAMYSDSVDDMGQGRRKLGASVDTLTQIIAVASTVEPTAAPTAPTLDTIERGEVQEAEWVMAAQNGIGERDPPFAPVSPAILDFGESGLCPLQVAPSAPSENTIGRKSPEEPSAGVTSEEQVDVSVPITQQPKSGNSLVDPACQEGGSKTEDSVVLKTGDSQEKQISTANDSISGDALNPEISCSSEVLVSQESPAHHEAGSSSDPLIPKPDISQDSACHETASTEDGSVNSKARDS